MIIPFITFPLIIIILIVIAYRSSKSQHKQHGLLVEKLQDRIVLNIDDVKCEVFLSGKKNYDYRFTRCDMYLTDDAMMLLGHRTFIYKTFYQPVIFTKNTHKYFLEFPLAKVIIPDKFNPNSFNKDVYIEFGESGFKSINVTINLKDISDDAKQKMKILTP